MTHYTASDLGVDQAHAYAESDDDEVIVTLVEFTAFHRERHPELFDEDGWLTDSAFATLADIVRERYKVNGFSAGQDGDEPHVSLEWVFDLADIGGDSAEAIHQAVWPMLAQALNETDPGTFGSPYVYADVAKELDR